MYSNQQEFGKPLKIKDEGLTILENAGALDFKGAGVSGAALGDTAEETIPGGSAAETFETIAKNLASYPYVLNYTGDVLDEIIYDLGGGNQITKAFTYTGDLLTNIALSGYGITGTLNKTFTYTGETLDEITYS